MPSKIQQRRSNRRQSYEDSKRSLQSDSTSSRNHLEGLDHYHTPANLRSPCMKRSRVGIERSQGGMSLQPSDVGVFGWFFLFNIIYDLSHLASSHILFNQGRNFRGNGVNSPSPGPGNKEKNIKNIVLPK
jgi:hypothetical protein